MDRRRFLQTLVAGVPAVVLAPYIPERAYFFLSGPRLYTGGISLEQIMAISHRTLIPAIRRQMWADSALLRQMEHAALTISP